MDIQPSYFSQILPPIAEDKWEIDPEVLINKVLEGSEEHVTKFFYYLGDVEGEEIAKVVQKYMYNHQVTFDILFFNLKDCLRCKGFVLDELLTLKCEYIKIIVIKEIKVLLLKRQINETQNSIKELNDRNQNMARLVVGLWVWGACFLGFTATSQLMLCLSPSLRTATNMWLSSKIMCYSIPQVMMNYLPYTSTQMGFCLTLLLTPILYKKQEQIFPVGRAVLLKLFKQNRGENNGS